MRRVVVFVLLMVVVVACGGKDDDPKTIAPTNTANLPPTLPPQQTVDPLQQQSDSLPTPTVSSITRTSVSRGPTLPPARTLDPEATSEIGLTLNPTATPRETRGTGPTLPPVVSQTVLPSPTQLTPTPSPTQIVLNPTVPPLPTIPDFCATFRIDLEQTNAEPPIRGEVVTIYWFAPQGTNLSYQVQLYNHVAALLVDEMTTDAYYAFPPEVFTDSSSYYWQVTALMNDEPMGCVPIGNELFLN